MLEQVATETLQEKAYRAIKDSIMRNDLLPGQPLSIDELSRDLGVSPTPVREALTRLSADGLVERTRNKTARVTGITEDDVHQTYEVRKLLEPYAVSLVARKVKEDPALRDKLHTIERKIKSVQEIVAKNSLSPHSDHYKAYLEIDFQLQGVKEEVENPLLKKLVILVGNHSLRIRSFSEAASGFSSSQIMSNVCLEHLEIVEALLSADQDRATMAVIQHLTNAEVRALRALREILALKRLKLEGNATYLQEK